MKAAAGRSKQPGTIEGLFAGRPSARDLFEMVRAFVESLGPVRTEATKTQISFGAVTKFAWVWLPQMWIKAQPEASITLTFDADHRIEDPRIKSAVEPRPGRWTHHVVIARPSDLDAAVRGWLRQAYEFGQIDCRRRRRDPGPLTVPGPAPARPAASRSRSARRIAYKKERA